MGATTEAPRVLLTGHPPAEPLVRGLTLHSAFQSPPECAAIMSCHGVIKVPHGANARRLTFLAVAAAGTSRSDPERRVFVMSEGRDVTPGFGRYRKPQQDRHFRVRRDRTPTLVSTICTWFPFWRKRNCP